MTINLYKLMDHSHRLGDPSPTQKPIPTSWNSIVTGSRLGQRKHFCMVSYKPVYFSVSVSDSVSVSVNTPWFYTKKICTARRLAPFVPFRRMILPFIIHDITGTILHGNFPVKLSAVEAKWVGSSSLKNLLLSEETLLVTVVAWRPIFVVIRGAVLSS